MTFTLTISLDNDDAAQDPRAAVASALGAVAESVKQIGGFLPQAAGKVKDANGNTIGHWHF